MQVLRDEYTQISLWNRPLKRCVYTFSEIRQAAIKHPKSATGALISSLEKAETTQGSGVLPSQARAPEILSMSEEDMEIADARARLEQKEDLSSLPRFRRLKARLNNKVFDFSEIKTEKIEEEIQNLVNKDGYYDEIEPFDADEEIEEARTINKGIIVVAGLIALLVGFLYFYIKTQF